MRFSGVPAASGAPKRGGDAPKPHHLPLSLIIEDFDSKSPSGYHRGSPLPCNLSNQFVPDATNGQKPLRMGGVLLNFLAQVENANVDAGGVEEAVPPH